MYRIHRHTTELFLAYRCFERDFYTASQVATPIANANLNNFYTLGSIALISDTP